MSADEAGKICLCLIEANRHTCLRNQPLYLYGSDEGRDYFRLLRKATIILLIIFTGRKQLIFSGVVPGNFWDFIQNSRNSWVFILS